MRAKDHVKGLSRLETSKLKMILISIIVSPATYNEFAKNMPLTDLATMMSDQTEATPEIIELITIVNDRQVDAIAITAINRIIHPVRSRQEFLLI